MNQAESELDAQCQGYEIREGAIKPNEHRPPHVHNWDARLFILEGALTLVRGDARETFGPGQSCSVPANTLHEEHTEADGVKYLAARRPASSQAEAAA